MMPSKTQTLAATSSSSQSLIFYLLCAGFVLNGVIINFIGPILTVFKQRWALDDAHAGLFATTQFACSLVGVLLSSALVSAKGFKPAITVGILMLGGGFALLNAPTFLLALLASGVYGLGYGLATPGTNLWVGESYGDRRASALNVMNLAWGAGAISASWVAMLAIRASSVSTALYLFGTLSVLLAIFLFRVPFGKPSTPDVSTAETTAASRTPAGLGVAIMLGILFYVYVGTEVSTSYWAVVHAQRAATWAGTAFTLAQMAFFAGLLGGRAAAAAILLKLREGTVATGGLLLAAFGELLFLTAHSPVVLFVGAFFAGLGLASLYPIWVAWLSKWFGTRARKVGGVLFALGSGGAATLPGLVGIVSRYSNSMRVGLLIPLAGCLVMLTVVCLLRPNTRG